MANSSNVRVVTLKDLWDIFIHRWWVIFLAAVIFAGGFYTVTKLNYKPRYQSTATLYILKQDKTEDNYSSEDFSLALKVVNDCDYLLKSHPVLDKVIEELNLDISYKDLSESVSTSNPEDTRILEVTVEADSPEEAKKIVDSVCSVGTEKIADAMGFNQVNLYEYGTIDENPCNHTRIRTYILIGLIAAVLTYTIFLVIFLVDDRIRFDEDIERDLGLTILGDIPDANHSSSNHYGYGGYGKKHPKGRKRK